MCPDSVNVTWYVESHHTRNRTRVTCFVTDGLTPIPLQLRPCTYIRKFVERNPSIAVLVRVDYRLINDLLQLGILQVLPHQLLQGEKQLPIRYETIPIDIVDAESNCRWKEMTYTYDSNNNSSIKPGLGDMQCNIHACCNSPAFGATACANTDCSMCG